MQGIKLKDLKKGEFFTRKPIEEPKERQVFIKDFYVREDKKYFCQRWSNISDGIELKGDTIVYTEFYF